MLFTRWRLILRKKTFANTTLTRCRFAYRLDIIILLWIILIIYIKQQKQPIFSAVKQCIVIFYHLAVLFCKKKQFTENKPK